MTPAEFRAKQRRARHQERAHQWPALDLQFVAVVLLAVVYVVVLATAPLWWWP